METDNQLLEIAEQMKKLQEATVDMQMAILGEAAEKRAERMREGEKEEGRMRWRSSILDGIRKIGSALASPVTDAAKSFWEKLKELVGTVLGMVAITEFMDWWQNGGGEQVRRVVSGIVNFFSNFIQSIQAVIEGYREGGLMGALTAVWDNFGTLVAGIGATLLAISFLFSPFGTIRIALRAMMGSIRLLRRGAAGLLRGLPAVARTAGAIAVGGAATAAGVGLAAAIFPTAAEAGTLEYTDEQYVQMENFITENPSAAGLNGGSGITPEIVDFVNSSNNPEEALQTLIDTQTGEGLYNPEAVETQRMYENAQLPVVPSLGSPDFQVAAQTSPLVPGLGFDIATPSFAAAQNMETPDLASSIVDVGSATQDLADEIEAGGASNEKIEMYEQLLTTLDVMISEYMDRPNINVQAGTSQVTAVAEVLGIGTR